MYPTDGKIRQKKLKEQGHEPKKKKFTIEDHADDCGNSLAGLGFKDDEAWWLYEDACEETPDTDSPTEELEAGHAEMPYHIFLGSEELELDVDALPGFSDTVR